MDDLLDLEIITPDEVYDRGVAEKICPFELSLDLSLNVSVVIGDYNYVFDPNVYLRRFFLEQKYDDIILIIDEAHNLYSRGREYYSPELHRQKLKTLISRLKNSIHPVLIDLQKFLESVDRHFMKLSKSADESDSAAKKFLVKINKDFFKKRKVVLDEIIMEYYIYRRENVGPVRQDPIQDFFYDFIAFYNVLMLEGDEFSYIYDREGEEDVLKILCKDPSKELGKRIRGFYATIAMSATLEPQKFYRDVLGFDRDKTIICSFPSPFPREYRKIVVVPDVSTRYKVRHRFYEKVGKIVGEITSLKKGNYFVFFPSFEYLEGVSPYLHQDDFDVISQERVMNEKERGALLKKLKSKEGKHLILAVQGGIFAEGVDYPGEMLIGVIVVGPGLPKVCFEQELIREYFSEQYGMGFEYAYLYPGMNRVIQSAGRLIRSEKDRGIIVLLGQRFCTQYYNSLFPIDWYEYSPNELVTRDYSKGIKKFWDDFC